MYRVTLPLTHYGSAVKVQVRPQNFKSLLNTALGVNNRLSISLQTAAAQRFAVGLPQHVAPDVPATGAGNLETPGAEDDYDFTVPDVPGFTEAIHVARSCSEHTKLVLRNAVTGIDHPCGSRRARLSGSATSSLVTT